MYFDFYILNNCITGNPILLPWRNPLVNRNILRSMSSNLFLLPDYRLWLSNETIIKTPEFNYTSDNYLKFFNDIDLKFGMFKFQNF